MKYSNGKVPLICMMTQSTCYRNTRNMAIKGILWHSTGANNPNVKRYVQPDDNAKDKAELLKLIGKNIYHNDWNHTSRQAGVNAFIGKLADGTVETVQVMPWVYRPWGCGSGKNGSCNNGWIQFEIAEDSLKDRTYFDKIYKEACELTAYLCKTYNIDPKGTVKYGRLNVPTILCHKDSANLGLGCDHVDIYHWFLKYGKTMEDVRNDVAKLLNERPGEYYDGPYPTLPKRGYFKQGDKGVEVGKLQKYLNWFGNYGLAVDGDLGPRSVAAVKAFQKAVGITADGLFGGVSLAAAKNYCKY